MRMNIVREFFILLLVLTLAMPTSRGLAQQSPEPITDTKPFGQPTSEQIATGQYKLTYRNKAGQIVKEEINEEAGELINIVRMVSRTDVLKIHTNGKPAQVVTTVFDNPKKLGTGVGSAAHPGHEEHYRYDRQGNPIEKITYTADDDGKIDRLHREVTTWPSGSGPNGVTVLQDRYPDGSWRDSRFQPKRDEKKTTGTKSVSANPGYTIQNDDSIAGLSAVSLGTPNGKIYLNLPSAISAGATISGSVVDQPDGKNHQEKEQHRINLNRFSLRLGNQPVPINNGVFRIAIPHVDAAGQVPTLHCSFGTQPAATVTLNVSSVSISPPASFTIPTGGQEGWPLVLEGPFDGVAADGDSVSVGTQRLPFMAETSDGFKVVRLSSTGEQPAPPVYGLTTIKIMEQGRPYECPFRRLGLALSSNRPLDLLRGESATIFIKVLGLAGLNQDVPLDIVNNSPEIIRMQGGEEHHRTIRTSDVQGDGTFLMERNVTGVQRGAFNITAAIRWENACYKEAAFAELPEIETWFDTATRLFRQGRQKADEANSASGRGDDASSLAADALQNLSRARDYVRRARDAGEISVSTAASISEYISRSEAEARQAKERQRARTIATSAPSPLPPPASRPSPTPTPTAVVTEGRFEPSQGVWQDDDYFADKPGKQLTRTGPTSWKAELKMVVGRYTGLFGIRADRRSRIRIMGTTNGTRLTRVKFRFTLIQSEGRRVVYEEPRAENSIPLEGPVGPVQPFEASLSASIGPPDFRPFKIDRAGPYTIEAELIRADGRPTGLKATVSGEAIETHPPAFRIVPVVLSDPLDQSKELESEARFRSFMGEGLDRVLPVQTDSIRVDADVTQDLRSLEPGALSHLWSSTADLRRVRVDSLVAAMGQRFHTASSLTNGEHIAVLLSQKDFALTRDTSEAFAYAVSQKVFVIQPGATNYTLAHEFIHQTPFIWSEKGMLGECGMNYHNSADVSYGNGVEIFVHKINRKDRQHAVMGPAYGFDTWITQCSYWHLLNYLVKPPDPDLFLVRGYLAKNDQAVAGSFDKFYELQGEGDLPSGVRSPDGVTIVVRDRANQVLAEYPFTPVWKNPDLDRDRMIVPFTFRIPSNPTAYRIELVSKNIVLDSRTISPHKPSLRITSPVARENVRPMANGLSVTWLATDADGDVLSYSVYYSPDNGENWRLVSYEQSNSSFVVAVRGRPRAARIRVIATDGTRSATDEVAFSFAR